MNQKGFTLIEIIVALAVSAILGLAILELVAPLYDTYHRVSEKADAQLIAGNVLDTLKNSAKTAKTVLAMEEVGDASAVDGVKIGRVLYTAENGLLLADGEPVYAPAYYAGKNLTMTAAQTRENMTRVTVYLDAEGELLAKASTVLSPLVNAAADYPADTAAGIYLKVLAAIAEYQGKEGASGILKLLKTGSYAEGYPQFDMETLIEKNRLEALASTAAVGGKLTDPLPAYYLDLANKTLTLTAYVATAPDQSHIPVVYLTDSPEKLNTQSYAPAYLVYFNGLWYARSKDNVASIDTMLRFDNKTKAEIESMLSESGEWVELNKLL